MVEREREVRAHEHAEAEYYRQMVQYNKKVQEISQINQKRSNERRRLLQLRSVLEAQDKQLRRLTDAKSRLARSEQNAGSSYAAQLARIQVE